MTITIPKKIQPLLEKQMASAGYEDAAKYLLALVERDRHRRLRKEVEEMLAEALKEPPSAMTKKDWAWIRREGKRMSARRKKG